MPRAGDAALSVTEMLRVLQDSETSTLRVRWAADFGRPAPKRMGRDLLLRILAYRVQEQVEGGLSKVARKRLAGAAGSHDSGDSATTSPVSRPKPGTRLVREWRGEAHHVTVGEDSFEYRGDRYRSLSEIERTITGTRWSGPLFFGLRKPASPSPSNP